MVFNYVKQLFITFILIVLIVFFSYMLYNGENMKLNIDKKCTDSGGVMHYKQCKLPNGDIRQFSFDEMRGIK